MSVAADVAAAKVFELAGSLNSAIDLDDLLQKIGAAAERLSDSEASSIMLVSDDKKSLYFRVASGEKIGALKTMAIPIGQGIAGAAAKNLKPELVEDTRSDPRFSGKFDQASGFQTRSVLCAPMIHGGELVGVIEVLNKRSGTYAQEDVRLLSSLASLASVAVVNAKTISDQKNFFSHVLELLSAAIENCRPDMIGHPERAARLACAIGREMGFIQNADNTVVWLRQKNGRVREGAQDYRMLYYAGLLHDIGYLAFKNKRLLEDWGVSKAVERMHPDFSTRMLEGIKILGGALAMIRHHHERFDGTGFPAGLKGADIPLGARILALVEAVEDLRMSSGTGGVRERAVRLAREESGRGLDPDVVKIFVKLMDQPEGVW